MALINLSDLDSLRKDFILKKTLFDTQCFNWPNEQKMDVESFVFLAKAITQMENLYKRLDLIYRMCKDIKEGTYLVVSDPNEEVDLHADIIYCLKGNVVYDLPSKIEQYMELYESAATFSANQKTKRQIFGDISGKIATQDKEGNLVMVPKSALSQEHLDAMEAKKEIQDINVEYTLDGYNEFYRKSTQLLEERSDIQDTVSEILSYFGEK